MWPYDCRSLGAFGMRLEGVRDIWRLGGCETEVREVPKEEGLKDYGKWVNGISYKCEDEWKNYKAQTQRMGFWQSFAHYLPRYVT